MATASVATSGVNVSAVSEQYNYDVIRKFTIVGMGCDRYVCRGVYRLGTGLSLPQF